jgi:hypothetical protein
LAFFQGNPGGVMPKFVPSMDRIEDNEDNNGTDQHAAGDGDNGNPWNAADICDNVRKRDHYEGGVFTGEGWESVPKVATGN